MSIKALARYDEPNAFAQLMHALRVRKGVSARALSTEVGLSPSYVSKLERSEFMPSVDTFAKIVDALECSDAEIVFLVRLLSQHD